MSITVGNGLGVTVGGGGDGDGVGVAVSGVGVGTGVGDGGPEVAGQVGVTNTASAGKPDPSATKAQQEPCPSNTTNKLSSWTQRECTLQQR
jgi:hypothetical protein